MEPITAAIMAVLPALAADTVKAGVKDAYEGLKAVIRRKWGDTAPVSKAITALEEKPKSKGQAVVLEEEVTAIKAGEDADVTQALRQLIEQMKAHGMSDAAPTGVQVTISGGTQTGIIGAGNVTGGSWSFGAASGT